ncbi:hypothetical protein JRO89_XS13G0140000 [Xanthoceras sorbifolium]|uniref:Uncharacterized protein n=1 Tax=Xanthoceras sorbifolium TaxID=99658 RepID=A0ABQ8H885_9ROSI|nr:hypothetical protein JRO89_XS13G0140000 [Xanthoceras sorbifolium]
MGGAQALKRIPRIKFPQRHSKTSGPNLSPCRSACQSQSASVLGDGDRALFSSSKTSVTLGGKASLQPKRTPVSNEEIEAILCSFQSSYVCTFQALCRFDGSPEQECFKYFTCAQLVPQFIGL